MRLLRWQAPPRRRHAQSDFGLDAQVWPPTRSSERPRNCIGNYYRRTANECRQGFSYGEDRDGVWTEGTAKWLSCWNCSAGLGGKIVARCNQSQRSPDGGPMPQVSEGYRLGSCWIPIRPSRLYFRLPHLGAASWAALAERGFNPFTATKDFRSWALGGACLSPSVPSKLGAFSISTGPNWVRPEVMTQS
jgi:hypothetical protein